MEDFNGINFVELGRLDKGNYLPNNSQESNIQAINFLKDHFDIISLEVFESSSQEFVSYLNKQIELRNSLYLKDLSTDEKAYRKLKALEEHISVLSSFLGIVDITFDILSKKAIQSLNFDVTEWEKYQVIKSNYKILLEANSSLHKQCDFWIDLFNQKLKQNDRN